MYSNIYSINKMTFDMDVNSVFTANREHIIKCRNMDNSFIIYKLKSLEVLKTIIFHKVL